MKIPTHLLSGLGRLKAPILAIKYHGDTASITLTSTTLTIIDNGVTVAITLTGRTTSEVVASITKSDLGYEAWVLFEVEDVSAIGLTKTVGDLTNDGAQVLRARGHVFRNLEQSRLRVLSPYNDDRHQPWYVRVERGTVVKEIDGASWVFSVPEYEDQAWSLNHGKPYVDQNDVLTERVSKNVVRVPRTPIFWKDKNLTLSIRGVTQPSTVIRDVDVNNGLVYLNGNFQEDEPIEATYTYEEKGFLYSGIDLNPTEFHNPAILDRFVVYYLLPYSGPEGVVRTACINHSEGSTLYGALMSIPRGDEPFLVLATTQTRQAHGKDDIEVTDTRVKGGGVKETRYVEALARTKNLPGLNDYGHYDGLPTPMNSTIVARLDEELRDSFDSEEIKAAFTKHAAYGSYVILEWR